MASDETNPKVSRERLNQIALRKLSSLSITAKLAADGKTVEGELPFTPGRVSHPVTGAPITQVRFIVLGHDHLRFLESPLSGLRPVLFYDAEKPLVLEQRVAQAMSKRLSGLKELDTRYLALRLKTKLDVDRLLVRAQLETVSHTFELAGDGEGTVRVLRVTPSRGKPHDVPSTYPPLQLSEFPSGLDLELYLTGQLPKLLQAAPAQAAEPAARPDGGEALVAVAPSQGAVTLAMLLERMGPEVTLQGGERLELSQELSHGSATYRFFATYEGGTVFKGRLVGPAGEKWAEKFDLTRFPGVLQLASTVLNLRPPPRSVTATATAGAMAVNGPSPELGAEASAGGGSHIAPQAGEVWVMNVIVEQDDGNEIRYACTDIDGKPYGATRLLKKADFQGVFVQHGIGWRLLIQIDEVKGDAVVYRQLNAARAPMSAPKTLAIAILTSNFIPEAAAY